MDFHYIEGVPRPLIWGHKPARLSLEITHSGTQLLRCENNNNLYLSSLDASDGVFRASSFLARLCSKHCRSRRNDAEVCPAFTAGDPVYHCGDFESAELPAMPQFHLCGGVEYLFEQCQTAVEKGFLTLWLELGSREGAFYREVIHGRWAEQGLWLEPMLNGYESRRDAYEDLMWQTIPGPALIPQVWINVLPPGHDRHGEIPQRLDFAAYYCNRLHAIEIDGQSHFADYVVTDEGPELKVDERIYDDTLKDTRYLESLGWSVARIGHAGVRELYKEAKINPKAAVQEIQRRTGMHFGVPNTEDAERFFGDLFDYQDVW